MNKAFLFMAVLLCTGLTFGQSKKNKTKTKEKVTLRTATAEERNAQIKEQINETDIGPAPEPKMVEDDETIYTSAAVEVRPDFPGGMKMMHQYIAKNIKADVESTSITRIVASFVIEKDGSLSQINAVSNSIFNKNEVIQALKKMPKWLPAEMNGKKVRCSYSFPIMISNNQ